MGTELCPECGHPTKVYSDAGRRKHESGCSLNSALSAHAVSAAPTTNTPDDLRPESAS